MENGGHFGRHLGFWRKLQGDSWGLLVCYFTHIPGHVLKNSACYEIFPGFNQCSWATPYYIRVIQSGVTCGTNPRTHNRFGDRSFAVAGLARLWNSLPISLRKISSYGQFRRSLKNHLFGIWEITAQCDAWFSALYKCSYLLTYLLT